MPDPTLTAPQARALRYYGAPQPRYRFREEIGGPPRWDVRGRLEALGLVELNGNPVVTTDLRLTDAGRRQLALEVARRGWSLPWHRPPYVGEGADGARRSAEIDRNEADTVDAGTGRHTLLLESAARWDAQAAELEATR